MDVPSGSATAMFGVLFVLMTEILSVVRKWPVLPVSAMVSMTMLCEEGGPSGEIVDEVFSGI
jgi:hypothetical protein